MSNRRTTSLIIIASIAFLLAACQQKGIDTARVFPAAGSIPGWEISQAVKTYNHDNLFDLVDGQADSFFAYGFEQVAVQRYADAAGTSLNVEIWQLATPSDAFGLFSAGRAGQPAAIGNEGDSDPGRRLSFWQQRYFVALYADQPVADETLLAFAQAISHALPAGGERPAILTRLPREGLNEQNILFFHEEISTQVYVYLSSENLLGLGQDTDGVIAFYASATEPVRLMLIQYPNEKRAAAGLAVLQSGSIDQVIAADRNGTLIGAVIGPADEAQAKTLLQEALK
jgi:hypothetical protein